MALYQITFLLPLLIVAGMCDDHRELQEKIRAVHSLSPKLKQALAKEMAGIRACVSDRFGECVLGQADAPYNSKANASKGTTTTTEANDSAGPPPPTLCEYPDAYKGPQFNATLQAPKLAAGHVWVIGWQKMAEMKNGGVCFGGASVCNTCNPKICFPSPEDTKWGGKARPLKDCRKRSEHSTKGIFQECMKKWQSTGDSMSTKAEGPCKKNAFQRYFKCKGCKISAYSPMLRSGPPGRYVEVEARGTTALQTKVLSIRANMQKYLTTCLFYLYTEPAKTLTQYEQNPASFPGTPLAEVEAASTANGACKYVGYHDTLPWTKRSDFSKLHNNSVFFGLSGWKGPI